MTVWDLEQGSERPVPSARLRQSAALTPSEIAIRARKMGARVELLDNRYRVYPPNSDCRPVFFSERFNNGNDRPNVLAALRRVGIDVLSDTPPETSKEEVMPEPKTSPIPGKPGRKSTVTVVSEAIEPLQQQIQAMFEMLTEAEGRDKERQDEIAEMRTRIDDLETRLAATPGAPAGRDPHAELDQSIIAFMTATPIKLTAGVIAANLDVEVPAELVAERLSVLVDAGNVTTQGSPGSEQVYRFSVKSPE